MAESTRIDALSIELQTRGKDKLAEEYGKVIENINANTLSAKLKNKDLSGDPTSGSVEAKRFVNAKGQAYGTARSGGAGNKVKSKPVVIPIDDNTEYMEEVEEKDLKLYGVNGLIERRTANHQKSMEVELETKFFDVAADAGTEFTPTETSIEDEIEEAIQKVETVKNDFVRGVPRNLINVIMKPSVYGKLRNKIATLPNANANVASYESGIFNNTRVYSNVFLPDDVDYIVMVDGAVAQPVLPSIYSPKKIDLSDATAFGMFLYKGTKAVMEDLIFVKKKQLANLGELTVNSVEGATVGNTKITVTPTIEEGHSYKYKVASNPTMPTYDQVCSSGYTNWNGTDEITATTGQKIVVVEVDSDNKAKKTGEATITSKAE